MAIVVTPPEKIGFSKDKLPWRFEDDREGIVPGIQSESILSVDSAILAGSQIIFRWGENDLRFTAAEQPGLYGSEFPTYPVYSLDTHEAYVKSLVPYFAGNYFLQKDFTVEAHPITISGPFGSVTIWTIKFTALLAGTDFNFNKTVFSGGGLTPNVTGTNDSTVVNNSAYVEVWMQSADASVFQLKYHAIQPFDANSIAEFDVSAILHSNLASEIPDMAVPVAERCNQSRRKYYLRYALAGGQNLSIGTLEQTEDFIVLLGGFAQWKSGPQSVIDTFKKPNGVYKNLSLRNGLRVVRQDEPVFISWVNFGASGRSVHARATVKFADDTELTTNTAVIHGVAEYEKLIFGVGFKQLNLGYFNGTGRTVKEFTITIQDDLGVIGEPYRLVVNYSHLEYVRYFAYINSYGAVETLMSYGKQSSNWKVFKEQAQKVLPYNFSSTQAQFVDWNATYQDNQEVATGWMRKKELGLWLDLFISPLKYRIIKSSAYAVQVNSDTVQRGSDGDNQYGLIFEYQFARIFDSVDEQLLEGEDTQDYIPSHVVLAGSLQTPSGSGITGGGGVSGPPALRVDPYPISNSDNPVSSDGVFRALAGLQKKLPAGTNADFYNGEGLPRNLKKAVNAAETDPTVPSYAKSLTGLNVIFNGLQAMNPGLNVNLFGGQLAEWYIKRMTHPAFDKVPPIVVTKGQLFEKYLDLNFYKTSYHPNEELTVDVTLNTLKLSGVQVEVNGQLLVKLTGTVTDDLLPSENVLLVISDAMRNQGTVSLRIQTIEDDPEVPDTRPVCPMGPNHYPQVAIEVINNGKIRAPFDGRGVPQLRWKIVNNDSDTEPLRAGMSVNDNGAYFIAEFEKLPGKTYRLGIQGDLCKSPWVYRDLVLPIDTTINWAEGYPKYNDQGSLSEFLAKIDQSIQALTELLNVTTNTKLYSEMVDYVANVTEHQIWRSPKYEDGVYRLSVGSLSKDITVGSPPEPPATIFKLVNGYDGSTIKDLLTGPYDGDIPSGGFNGYFQSQNIGFSYTFGSIRLFYEVNGVYVQIPNVGQAFVVSGVSQSLYDPIRLFSVPGTDSRVIAWNNEPINRGGKFKIVAKFSDGENGPVKGTFEQTFELNQIKIASGWVNVPETPGGRVRPAIGGVQYNGKSIFNNSGYVEPWASAGLGDASFQYSFDKTTWYNTGVLIENVGGVNKPNRVILLNNGGTDRFPAGTIKTVYVRNGMKQSVISAPYEINLSGEDRQPSDPLMTQHIEAGDRDFYFNETPDFKLAYNNDGSVSDDTDGMVEGSGSAYNTHDGKYVFYTIGYFPLQNKDGSYKRLKDIFLPNGPHVIGRFVCNPSPIANFDYFKSHLSGYNNGVSSDNSYVSEIFITAWTIGEAQGLQIAPKWLKPSYDLIWPSVGSQKDLFAYNMAYAQTYQNRGSSAADYNKLGANTYLDFGISTGQPRAFITARWPNDNFASNEALYELGRHYALQGGSSESFMLTDEIPENRGNDADIYARMYHFYKGYFDVQVAAGHTNKRKINAYGSYGMDNGGVLGNAPFFGTWDNFEKSLTTHVHRDFDPATLAWAGNCGYYTSSQVTVRNLNYKMYLERSVHYIPYLILFVNERGKIGTKTWNGTNNESEILGFSWNNVEPLVSRDEPPVRIGIEYVSRGEIIRFANGKIRSMNNLAIPALWDEQLNMTFWSMAIFGRYAMWNAPGARFGSNEELFDWYMDSGQPVYWTPDGGSEEPWVSGQNGAPVISVNGISARLWAASQDASNAGMEAAWLLRNHRKTIKHIAYSSSEGSYSPTPGEAGLNINGFGPLNMRMFECRRTMDAKKAITMEFLGDNGLRALVFYNGHISVHEYEDNVTIGGYNLGKCHGRTTYLKFVNSNS